MPEVLNQITGLKKGQVHPENVHRILRNKLLVDGFDLVLDFERSKGVNLVDAKTGDIYLDFFSFFGSSPLGINHPKLHNPEYVETIARIARTNKPSNSDLYTVEMAEFVDTVSRIATPEIFKYMFFVDGGSVAVENALKAAFDWKIKKNFQKGHKEIKGSQILHFNEAFHGRTGYCLSLTNTDPVKILNFPKFNWPRVINPKIRFPVEKHLNEITEYEKRSINEIYAAIKNNPDDIAAIIIEPIQAEGGDNHFRKEFLVKLREIANENDILLIFDEVQTGLGLTGRMWAYQHFVEPDIIAFGKKMQVCGIMANNRIEEVSDNVFKKPGRINSTWGGNLVDMIRSKRNLEIIEEDNLVENAKLTGEFLLEELKEIQIDFPGLVKNARGLGLMCAFDLPDKEIRNKFLDLCYKNKLLILPCGVKTIRFRPVLNITEEEIERGLKIIRNVLYLLRKNIF